MKELADIVHAFEQMVQEGQRMALATVVQVEGSSYRRPGARMLVSEEGRYIGAISGGCLEGEALRKAALAITQGKKKLVVYDTTDEDDAKLGVQLGCNGIVSILFEPLDGQDKNLIKGLQQMLTSRRPQVLVTGFNRNHKEHLGTLLNNEWTSLESLLFRETVDKVLLQKKSEYISLNTSLGQQEVYVEYIMPPISLIIVGAGNDTVPLESMARLIGWKTTIVDGRPTHANGQRFPNADCILVGKPELVLPQLNIDERTAIVLMTHNYNYDLAFLQAMHAYTFSYIGLLGPAAKRDRLLSDLRNQGLEFAESQIKNLFGPTGLALGAETSAEIALSVCAEIMAVMEGRVPLHLRDQLTPIHSKE